MVKHKMINLIKKIYVYVQYVLELNVNQNRVYWS